MKKYLYFFIFFTCGVVGDVQAQTINTLAGSNAGFSGDGAAAAQAQLNHPFGICSDNVGNIYIADRGNGCIRMVSSSGTITTIAGTGNSGYNGDNIQATSAVLNDPVGVAVDNAGNVYIADRGNNRIRKVNSSGIITTIAGTGTTAYSGDGGPANMAEIYSPRGVAVDPDGNVYIADQWNHRVRKINSSGIITTIAGTGVQGYSGDGAAATSAQVNNPANMCFDSQGNIYIADVGNERIRKIDNAGTITTIAGNGTIGSSGDNGLATAALLSEPISVSVDNMDRIYIADGNNNKVRMINGQGIITTVAGTGTAGNSGDGGAATAAELHHPYGIAIDPIGNLCIADYENHRIRRVDNPTKVGEATVSQESVRVFPNPSNGNFAVSMPSNTGAEMKVMISDVLGKQLKELTVCNNCMIEASPLPKGVYILTATLKNEVWCEKLEIE